MAPVGSRVKMLRVRNEPLPGPALVGQNRPFRRRAPGEWRRLTIKLNELLSSPKSSISVLSVTDLSRRRHLLASARRRAAKDHASEFNRTTNSATRTSKSAYPILRKKVFRALANMLVVRPARCCNLPRHDEFAVSVIHLPFSWCSYSPPTISKQGVWP